MHIAATSPLALDASSLPRDFVEKEQAVMAEVQLPPVALGFAGFLSRKDNG